MKKQLTAILDLKTKSYGYIQTTSHIVEAERTLQDVISQGTNNIAKYPQDFQLMLLADYDTVTGIISPISPPTLIRNAIDFKPEHPHHCE